MATHGLLFTPEISYPLEAIVDVAQSLGVQPAFDPDFHPEEDNEAYVASLSAADKEAYYQRLYGESRAEIEELMREGIEPVTAGPSFMTGGCRGDALAAVPSVWDLPRSLEAELVEMRTEAGTQASPSFATCATSNGATATDIADLEEQIVTTENGAAADQLIGVMKICDDVWSDSFRAATRYLEPVFIANHLTEILPVLQRYAGVDSAIQNDTAFKAYLSKAYALAQQSTEDPAVVAERERPWPYPTELTSGASATNGSSYLTGTISPTKDALVVAAVATSGSVNPQPTPTMSGAGLTWTRAGTTAHFSDAIRVTLFRGMKRSPSVGGPVTISIPSSVSRVQWSIVEFEDVNLSGVNGEEAIWAFHGASRVGPAAGAEYMRVNFHEPQEPHSSVFAAFASTGASPIGVDPEQVDRLELLHAAGVPAESQQFLTEWGGMYRFNSVDAVTDGSNVSWVGVALEIPQPGRCLQSSVNRPQAVCPS